MRIKPIAAFLIAVSTISGSAAAVDVSPRISDREIIERLTRLEEGQRAMREYIDQRFSAVDERFSSIEQRLSAVEQRLSAMEQRFSAMEQRFSAMEQRFPAMEQRFSTMQAHSEQRFSSLDKRMDAQWQLTLVLITAIFGLIGFVVWDRKTAFKPLEERVEQRCKQVTGDVQRDLEIDSPHGSRLTRAIDVLRELAREDPRLAKALRRAFLFDDMPREAS
ncbi:MAG: Maltoporin N-terminal extension [Candidatus Kentron sp. G]|nr:MAG: Maltoporin N-terminal extension [Candidatus Kentron sp. G]